MSMNSLQDTNRLQTAVANSVQQHWKMFLAEGVVLSILGFLALLIPSVATLGITILLGWLFLVSGVMGLIAMFWTRGAPGFWWSLISALLGVGAGVVLLAQPVSGAISLTLVLIVFFAIEGIATIMYALQHRQKFSGRWGWMLSSGIVDLILAAMIFTGLPGTAAWALGVLVGINMIFGGSALIAMALQARKGASISGTITPLPGAQIHAA